MAVYATFAELETYLGDRVPLPIQPEAERMLARASELIAAKTRHWAEFYWVEPRIDPPTAYQSALTVAAMQQVEFWLEIGEEHDIVGQTGGANIGRVNYGQLPPRLAPRARDTLVDSGLLSGKVAIV